MPPLSTSAPAAVPRQLCSPEKVYGWPVEDSAGRQLGSVNHLLIDLRSGNVAYAVVASGGFLGLGESRFPLAWAELALADDGSHRLIWHGRQSRGAELPLSVPAALLGH